jgi:hypothetical protein
VIAEPAPEVVLGRHLGEISDRRPSPSPDDSLTVVGCSALAGWMAAGSLLGLAAATALTIWLTSAVVAVPLAVIVVAIGAVRVWRASLRLRGKVNYLPLPAGARTRSVIAPASRVFLGCWPLTLFFGAAAALVGARGLAATGSIAALFWFGHSTGYWVSCLVDVVRDERRRGCRLLRPLHQDSENLKAYLGARDGGG